MEKKSGHKVMAVRIMADDLDTFIDRLAEDIVLSDDIPACVMCAIGECEQQVSGLVCRNAVKAWLLSKAGEYLHTSEEAEKMEKYFEYLEQLRESGAVNMFGAIPYLQAEFPELEHDRSRAVTILQAWMNGHKEGGQ